MPRTPRVEFPGGVYHVLNRGLERRDIVRDNLDRHTWVRLLSRVVTRCHWRVFAYVLLNNHFHLFLRIAEANLSRGMHDLESGYATLFNKRHDRVGPLFQGRFKSLLVELDAHAWELSRYLHLNPVRAGLADHPFRYRWSSFRYYLNPQSAPAWLDGRTVLAEFSAHESHARLAYKRFVEEGLAHPPGDPLKHLLPSLDDGDGPPSQGILVPQPVRDGMPSADDLLASLLENVQAAFGVSTENIRNRGRQNNHAREAAMLVARQLLGPPLAVVAEAFGRVGVSTVSQTVRRARERCAQEPHFRQQILELVTRLQGSGVSNFNFAGSFEDELQGQEGKIEI